MSETPTETERPESSTFHGLVARSDEMRELFQLVRRVAQTDMTVLIRGESGTGKEHVARALHALSPRSAGPFRAVNCATLTGDLLASELFGHVRGAFTGAVRDRKGLFASAKGGTLFLDEVAELPLNIQPRLLRVLQTREFVPVGGVEPQKTDVRVLAATHRALRREVSRGAFRADLMYRIRVRPLFVPPLRDRKDDIEVLLWHFIDAFNEQGHRWVEGVEPLVWTALRSYNWPGNVRELRNVVEGAFAFGEGPVLTMDELTPELRGESPPSEPPLQSPLEDRERARILGALEACGGHRGKAADRLGISRTTLWRRLRELGL